MPIAQGGRDAAWQGQGWAGGGAQDRCPVLVHREPVPSLDQGAASDLSSL